MNARKMTKTAEDVRTESTAQPTKRATPRDQAQKAPEKATKVTKTSTRTPRTRTEQRLATSETPAETKTPKRTAASAKKTVTASARASAKAKTVNHAATKVTPAPKTDAVNTPSQTPEPVTTPAVAPGSKPEMDYEMLVNFGKKRKGDKTLKAEAADAKAHSRAGVSHLMTMADFLNAYPERVIPIYQRVTGWKTEQKEVFKASIERLFNDPKAEPFFIGTLSVAHAHDTKGVYVIDGQQRLTTLFELFRGAFTLVRKNTLVRSVTSDVLRLPDAVVADWEALAKRIVFVVHDYGDIDLEEQILAFDELNRHEEAFRLADMYRAAVISALPKKDRAHFSQSYDQAWRLATVLYRVANFEDYELSMDIDDTERPAERPSLFRLPSHEEIKERIAPGGTPLPFIPEQLEEDRSLLPLPDGLSPLDEETEDDHPLVSVRARADRQAGIAQLMKAFVEEVKGIAAPAPLLSSFLESENVFAAQRALDYADHLSTKAKLFHFLCYLRAANPNSRLPITWADAFGRTLSGGLEKLLPVKEGILSQRDAQRVLKRLDENNAWVMSLFTAYRPSESETNSLRTSWLAIVRFLGDGWLQIAERGDATLASQMMEGGVYFTESANAQLWHTLEGWAAQEKGNSEAFILSLRARECVLYKDIMTENKRLVNAIAEALTRHFQLSAKAKLSTGEKPIEAAQTLVTSLKATLMRRVLPYAHNDTSMDHWIARGLTEVDGKVPEKSVQSWANCLLLDKTLNERFGEIHPDYKASVLTANLDDFIPWPNTLLWMALQAYFPGAKTAKALEAEIAFMTNFWSLYLR